MHLKQLSVFLENKPGQLLDACRVLEKAGINIITLTLADTQQFGILRLIVADPEKGMAALEAEGIVVKVADVIAVEVADQPGGLAAVLAQLDAGGLNIEYMYAFTFRSGGNAVLVFRFQNTEAAVKILNELNLTVVRSSELARLAGK